MNKRIQGLIDNLRYILKSDLLNKMANSKLTSFVSGSEPWKYPGKNIQIKIKYISL